MNTIFKKIGRNNLIKFCLFKLFKPQLHLADENPKEWFIYYNTSNPFLIYNTNLFEPFINESFNVDPLNPEDEYLIHYKKHCTIEPNIGWALNSENQVIQFSLPYGGSGIWPLPHYIYYKRKKYIDIESGVSIRFNWFNYWHFYSDVVGQLLLLEKLKFDKSIPLIIPAKVLELEYVRSFMETRYAKSWNWFYQDSDTYVRLKSAFFCKCIPNIKDQFLFTAQIFAGENLINKSDTQSRIFLTRKKDKGRTLSNMNEILELVEKNNFTIIDSDNLDMATQVKIFRSSEIIVALHGAGLTNMVYRYPQRCKVIEILPRNMIPPHYYWLAKELEFDYYPIIGDVLKDKEYYLPVTTFVEGMKVAGEKIIL